MTISNIESWQAFPASYKPLGHETGEGDEEERPLMPQGVAMDLGDGGTLAGQGGGEFIEFLQFDYFAAGLGGKRLEQGAVGREGAVFGGSMIGHPAGLTATGRSLTAMTVIVTEPSASSPLPSLTM